MSSKPASVGAPRVLLYVADPRQLEPGPGPGPPPQHRDNPDSLYIRDHHNHLALQRNILYRPPIEPTNRRNSHSTYFYKTNKDPKRSHPENSHQGTELYHETHYLNEPAKLENRQVSEVNGVKDRCGTQSGEFEPLRIPVEEEVTYQTRGPGHASESIMPVQSVALRQTQSNSLDSCTSQSDETTISDKSLSVGKGYVNYQFLEQNVSHQSTVNQSISFLNQQVGVNRGYSEGEGGSGAQLVRTPDGVVLAVLPSSQPQEAPELTSQTQSESQQIITVPLGWRRVVSGSSVLYISPSGTALSALPQLREYLQTAGTCKCGLPCPLRPENTFSFDPKVVSKPYQPASGAELTKLCNHKRKLLATLAARAHSPATPPPHHIEQKKVPAAEVGMMKKKMPAKMRKRAGLPPHMSQIMVQREPSSEFMPQDIELHRTISPGVGVRPNSGQSCMPNYAPVPQHLSVMPQDKDIKQDSHLQRSSHYLTVSSGWISQQESSDSLQKQSQTNNPSLGVGLPVLGNNGQIIGVNTGYNKQANAKNAMNMYTHNIINNITDSDHREERKEAPNHHSMPTIKQSDNKNDDSQVFCGLNQALTPEVMQKINEQQQIFIQQNQKQIEMAMKGFRTQLAENINQKSQNQFVPQGQLVIQNGAVVKTNSAKTPPWQVKRSDAGTPNSVTSPKPQKLDSMEFEDNNANVSEDSTLNSFQANEHAINQAMCSRVPPLPQHYNMMNQNQQWPGIDANKKKGKAGKGGRKKASPTENKIVSFGNNGMRIIQEKGEDVPNNAVPSFMDDPNGYLAQQTVLLNNTISRQVGMSSNFEGNHYDRSANVYNSQNQIEKMVKPMNKPCDIPNAYRNYMISNPSPSTHSAPDSSVLTDKGTENQGLQCCKGCNVAIKSSPDFSDNQMRFKYMKPNMYKMELEGHSAGFDDSPVTSTYIERSPMTSENCPIQAGTVSTSNVSPTVQVPEPSPTLSNSSRNTDTPLSGLSNSQLHCSFTMPSPAYSNPGSSKDSYNSNPSTPGQNYLYNSPGPPTNQITGTQMMHFISNHNVNKNLMEVDNISMVGVKPVKGHEVLRSDRRRVENAMPGYCPPPHLGGGPAHSLIQTCYIQTYVTTMASGFSVTRDTVTSVLAGKANTATTSINAAQANFMRPPPPPSVNLATTYAIPNNQPDPFINSVNLPTSYPLHIAGTAAQNMISKSPMEMVQNVIGSGPSKHETNSQIALPGRRTSPTTPGQILISSTGQIIVSNNQMPPPPPKTATAASAIHASTHVTNVTTSVMSAGPGVGSVNQSTVVVNTVPAPFVIQPPVVVDNQVVQQNTVLPQIVGDAKNGQGFVQGVAMLSPESMKKRGKKKKGQPNITNILQIAAPQQNSNNIVVHSSPQHNTSPQFSPRGFQLSPNNNLSPTPMLQALTIVPGKSGTPAHIVMNGQGNTSNFGSQQIITNTSPSQQINLLQPVNLINNANGVLPNFPAFQQFLVPNLGGMMMTADGTAIIQDNSSGMPVQLQLQTVNGQNVLTPVQNTNVFGANSGMVIRAQNQQGKILQSQHSPGAQFLSPNSQVMMSSPNFNGQLSPLLANLSPTSVTFNTSPHQVRSGNMQTQEFIQTNQMGQTLMVPLSPKQVPIASGSNNSRGNSTFVHQNTTIVQQQTTLVSNSHNTQMPMSNNIQGANRLSIDPNVLLAKQMPNQKGRFVEMLANQVDGKDDKCQFNQMQDRDEPKLESADNYVKFLNEFGPLVAGHVRHSVSTQTLVGRSPPRAGSNAPDTTTHSPPAPPPETTRAVSTQGNYADTTTKSPEPADANSSAMVQCVSSSQDMADGREHAWTTPRSEFGNESDTQNIMSNISMARQNRTQTSIENTEMHYNQSMSTSSVANHHIMPVSSNYYDRPQAYKRKNDFGDGSSYRTDKIMRSNNGMVHGVPKDADFDSLVGGQERQARHFQSESSSSVTLQKVFGRHNLGSGDDTKSGDESDESDPVTRKFEMGDLVWGPVKGFASWPGKLEGRREDGLWTVRWFGGDKAAGRVEDSRLLTLSEGLEAHHAARIKHRKSRKLNTLLENAIQEAMAELDKKTEREQGSLTVDGASEMAQIGDTPKRSKKDKSKKDKHHKKKMVVSAKTGDSSRLRSTR